MMDIKIPQTKREAYAQLDEMLSEDDKSAIMNGDLLNSISRWGCGFGITGSMNRRKQT